jgi:hypothetical protein
MRIEETRSEVARLLAQIDAEYQAAHNGLYGLAAGSTRHDFIQKRMERVGELGEQLIAQMGKEAAIPLLLEAMEAGSRQGQREQRKGECEPLFSTGTG